MSRSISFADLRKPRLLRGIAVCAPGSLAVTAGVMLIRVGGSFLAAVSASNHGVAADRRYRTPGRVMALQLMAFTAAYPLGALAQGELAYVAGPVAGLAPR